MNWYRADLHIHSVLSPCSGLEMSPRNIMQAAKERDISLLAITDHNSMANCATYQKMAVELDLNFLWGVEIQTIEEIHVVALFDDERIAIPFDQELYDSLLPIDNNPEFFGDQVVIDEQENIVRFEKRALINSSRWTLNELVSKLESLNSFYFPAHIDSHSYSIIGQLGFIPEDIRFSALGITANCDLAQYLKENPRLTNYSFVRSSDAHYVQDIGKGYTEFFIEKASVEEMRLACQNKGQRKYVV